MPTPEGESSGTPWWAWLLVVLVLGGIAAAVVLWSRARRQRAEWSSEYAASLVETRWFAGTLLPTLSRVPGRAERAGGWTVARPRVIALESRLETLHPTAADELERTRIHTLRTAVQAARETLDAMVVPGAVGVGALTPDLAGAQRRLQDALAAVEPPAAAP